MRTDQCVNGVVWWTSKSFQLYFLATIQCCLTLCHGKMLGSKKPMVLGPYFLTVLIIDTAQYKVRTKAHIQSKRCAPLGGQPWISIWGDFALMCPPLIYNGVKKMELFYSVILQNASPLRMDKKR